MGGVRPHEDDRPRWRLEFLDIQWLTRDRMGSPTHPTFAQRLVVHRLDPGIAEQMAARNHLDTASGCRRVVQGGPYLETRRLVEVGLSALPGAGPSSSQAMEAAISGRIREFMMPPAQYYLHYDPRPTLQKLRVPVLVLNGELDEFIEAYLRWKAKDG